MDLAPIIKSDVNFEELTALLCTNNFSTTLVRDINFHACISRSFSA